MKVTFKTSHVEVTRDPGDPVIRTDSRLMYHMVKVLKSQGYDVIKKRMWKDGHLVSDEQQYIRSRRNRKHKPVFYIYDTQYAIRDAWAQYHEDNKICFAVHWCVSVTHPGKKGRTK